MAYAPHTNADTHLPRLLGCFCPRDAEHYFEYAARPADDRAGWLGAEFPHLVYVGGGETRIAKVLKTVAHVVVDEDGNGDGVVEIWPLQHHQRYP